MDDILLELATQDPLDDRAFKILLSDDEQFVTLAEAFSAERLDADSIVDINGEIVLTVKGRLIRLDTLRDTNIAYINIEGQIEPALFPYKRHLFHGTVVYTTGIQKSESFQNLKPVISIVVYKKKSDAKLIENASMAGDLIKTDDDKKQLVLIAINTEKWQDAESEELRAYLSTLHHGIMTEENKGNFINVDVESVIFKRFQRAVKLACARTKQQEYKEKGDEFMATKYASFLTDEERIAAEDRGKELGLDIAQEILQLLYANVPVPEIAKRCQVHPKKVEEYQVLLKPLRST